MCTGPFQNLSCVTLYLPAGTAALHGTISLSVVERMVAEGRSAGIGQKPSWELRPDGYFAMDLHGTRHDHYDEATDGPRPGSRNPHYRPSAPHEQKPVKNAKVKWFDRGDIVITDDPMIAGPPIQTAKVMGPGAGTWGVAKPQYRSARPLSSLPKLEPLPPLFTQPFKPPELVPNIQQYGIESVDPLESPWWGLRKDVQLHSPARQLRRPSTQTAFPSARFSQRALDVRMQLAEQRSSPEFAQEMHVMRSKLNSAFVRTTTPRPPSGVASAFSWPAPQ